MAAETVITVVGNLTADPELRFKSESEPAAAAARIGRRTPAAERPGLALG
jgi:single-stranded DNA-binding protein